MKYLLVYSSCGQSPAEIELCKEYLATALAIAWDRIFPTKPVEFLGHAGTQWAGRCECKYASRCKETHEYVLVQLYMAYSVYGRTDGLTGVVVLPAAAAAG